MSDKPTIVEALAAVMEDVSAVGKTGRNQQQGYNFRGIDAVVNAVGPAFRKHGVIAVPLKSDAKYRDVQTTKGNPMRECTVAVTYRFYGPGGDFIDCEVPGESMDVGDKGAPKAMSVAYRIALLQVLCIPTDEPDADSQSYERAAESRPRPPQWDWDPIEQETLITAWTAEIEDAKTPEQLKDIGRRLLLAKRPKRDGEQLVQPELSPASYDKLAIAGGRRTAELKPAEVPA